MIGARRLIATQPAGGGFSPLDLPTLSGWWDASDVDSFTYSAGTLVSQWDDLSGNGRHLNRLSDTPDRSRTVNGLTVVDFATESIGRDSCPINNATDGSWTVFAVAVLDTTSGVQSVVDSDKQSGTSRVGQIIRANGTTSQSLGFRSTTAFTDSGSTLSTATTYLFRSVNTGTSIELFVDGVSGGSTAITGGTQNYDATTPFTLGGSAAAGQNQRLDGAICEVITCSSDLGASDISAAETYLANKWGITL